MSNNLVDVIVENEVASSLAACGKCHVRSIFNQCGTVSKCNSCERLYHFSCLGFSKHCVVCGENNAVYPCSFVQNIDPGWTTVIEELKPKRPRSEVRRVPVMGVPMNLYQPGPSLQGGDDDGMEIDEVQERGPNLKIDEVQERDHSNPDSAAGPPRRNSEHEIVEYSDPEVAAAEAIVPIAQARNQENPSAISAIDPEVIIITEKQPRRKPLRQKKTARKSVHPSGCRGIKSARATGDGHGNRDVETKVADQQFAFSPGKKRRQKNQNSNFYVGRHPGALLESNGRNCHIYQLDECSAGDLEDDQKMPAQQFLSGHGSGITAGLPADSMSGSGLSDDLQDCSMDTGHLPAEEKDDLSSDESVSAASLGCRENIGRVAEKPTSNSTCKAPRFDLCTLNTNNSALVMLDTHEPIYDDEGKRRPASLASITGPTAYNSEIRVKGTGNSGSIPLQPAQIEALATQSELISGDVTTAYLHILSRFMEERMHVSFKATSDFVWTGLRRSRDENGGDWKGGWDSVLRKKGKRKAHYNLMDDRETVTVLQLFDGDEEAGHFSCVVIDRTEHKDGVFTFFDSGKVFKFNNMESMRECFEGIGVANERSIWIDAAVPQQAKGSNDCGIWMCLFIASFLLAFKERRRKSDASVQTVYNQVTTKLTPDRIEQDYDWLRVGKNLNTKLIGWLGRAHIREALEGDGIDNGIPCVFSLLKCVIE